MQSSLSDSGISKWQQHLMLQAPPVKSGCIWVHACSVGEVGSVAPLITAILDQGHHIHLTVVTATGFAHAQRLLGTRISISYLPWDLPTLFTRFVRKLKPALLLLAETEFWPGMLRACRQQNVEIIGINTRISDRSFPRYHASRVYWQRILGPVSLFLAQSKVDAERLVAMGVESEKVRVAGNLKYAITAPEVNAEKLRQQLDPGGSRPILLVASTHDKEDEKILDMWPAWHTCCPELLTVIVPRHPQRFEAVANKITERGLVLHRWSALAESDAMIEPETDIYLADTLGELGLFYRLADIAFVGGSMASHGGHNPLEAAQLDCAVLHGPDMANFATVARQLADASAARMIQDTEDLAAAKIGRAHV